MIKFIQGLFMDSPDSPSMKRFIALFLSILLGITLYHNSFSESHIAPSDTLVYCVTGLIALLLGIKAVEKIFEIIKK
jgi:hypothetical protein